MEMSRQEVCAIILLFATFACLEAAKVSSFLQSAVEEPAFVNTLEESSNETEVKWDYGCGSENGPENWGYLSSDWIKCSIGTEQSPIRILTFDAIEKEDLDVLDFRYFKALATLTNDGHGVRLKWNAGYLRMKGIRYELQEGRFHTPSEHSIDGKIYPMEMQLLHRSMVHGTVAIISVLFKLDDESNEFLDQFWPYLPSSENDVVNVNTPIDIDRLELHEKRFYRYMGSLTSPPCTEGVIWSVMKKRHKASPMQLDKLAGLIKSGNARPIQPLNGRLIYKWT